MPHAKCFLRYVTTYKTYFSIILEASLMMNYELIIAKLLNNFSSTLTKLTTLMKIENIRNTQRDLKTNNS